MRKGSRMSAESRQKMRRAKTGKPSNWKGKTPSEASRRKMSISRRAFFKRIDPSYEYILDSKTRQGGKRIRRERMKIVGGSHTNGEWETLKAQYDWTCRPCGRREPQIKLTRDHIVAISKGGADNIENIQPLCNSCNAKKGTITVTY